MSQLHACLTPLQVICPSDSAGLLSRLLHAALQSGTPHSTASAQNGGDFPAEQASTLHSQNSGADDIAPKTRSPEKDASLDGSAMERTAAASQNATLAAALAEANAQSSEASQAHVTAGGRGSRSACFTALHIQHESSHCCQISCCMPKHKPWSAL